MWDEFIDYVSRPQQALFGFAKRGSDAFGAINTKLQDRGMNPGIATATSAVASMIPGALGAYEGLTGKGKFNAWDLTEGATDSKPFNEALGNFIEFTADPMGAIPIGGASQKLGTGMRTARNLWDMRSASPQAFSKVMDNGLVNALKMDISHSGAGNLPVMIRGEGDLKPMVNSLGYKSSNPNSVSGFISPDAKFMAADVTKEKPSWLHEFVHDTTKRFIDPEEAKRAYEAFYNAVGQGAKQRIAIDYPGLVGNLPRLGEELYAIITKQNTPEVLSKIMSKVEGPASNTLKYVGDMANKRLAQVNTSAANPLKWMLDLALPGKINSIQSTMNSPWDTTEVY